MLRFLCFFLLSVIGKDMKNISRLIDSLYEDIYRKSSASYFWIDGDIKSGEFD